MIKKIKRKYYNLVADKKFSEILKGSAFALAARIIATGLTLVATVIAARFYGAESVGVWGLVNALLTLVTIFTVMGTGTSILRLIPEHVAKYSVTSAFNVYRKTQYMVAAVSILTGTLFFFVSGVIAVKVFSKPHLSFLFAVAAAFVVFKSLMDLNTQAVRGLKLIRTFAVMQIVPALAMLIVLLATTLISHDSNNPVYSQLAAFGITAVIGLLIMHRSFKNRINPDDVVQTMPARNILGISTPMMISASMIFFIGQAGVIMLGMFRSEAEVGYYSVAVKLSSLTAFILVAVNSMVAPRFSELYHTGKMDELFHVAKKSTKLIFWTSSPILFFLLILGKPTLAFCFGAEFKDAYLAMTMLVVGQFINSISGSTGYFMNMTDHQDLLKKVSLIAAFINIGFSLLLIPRFGINGTAFAGMISLVFWNVYILVFIKARYGRTIGYIPLVRLR